jgi:uncharacterized membrane protein YqiK
MNPLLAEIAPELAITIAIAATIAVVVVSTLTVFVKSWKKASAEMAFVRTGKGGEKVVISGGALVFGFLHNIRMISLETMQLEVARKGEQALIIASTSRSSSTSASSRSRSASSTPRARSATRRSRPRA